MKILYRTLQLSIILLFVGLFTSCNKAKDETPNADSPKSDATAMLNIRYIDKVERLYDVSPVYSPAYEATTCDLRGLEEAKKLDAAEVEAKAAEAVAEQNKKFDYLKNY